MTDRSILVHGGTRRSAKLVRRLLDRGIDPYITVTRESARDLYPDQLDEKITVNRLDNDDLIQLIQDRNPAAILDATHPFADKISRLAMSVARERDLPYLFLDRTRVLPQDHGLIDRCSDWKEASKCIEKNHRVLLTVGIKRIGKFTDRIDPGRLIVRVLPQRESLESLDKFEVPRSNRLAIWPPVSPELEATIIDDYEIGVVVTKESGSPAGTDNKWEACKRTDTPLIVVERPEVDYSATTNDIQEAVEWGQKRAVR